MYIALTGYC